MWKISTVAWCRMPATPLAQAAMADVFRLDGDSEWRGLGVISDSGVQLTPAYQRFDAEAHFRPAPQRVCDDPRRPLRRGADRPL
ncbi:[NiFe] hydrogenase metallocenter assembly protein HypD [Klebsiella pneumoniae subsp. rhinoscleromatis]|nr:[NiFe] hydrogenase metallocenter assembly protein HypD [Klebsiella pneumoniae subsp. rhinoscleromatis]